MFIRTAQAIATVLIVALAAVAVGSGISGMIGGPSGPALDAAVESNVRFLSAFLTAAGVVLIWCLFRFRTAAAPLRLVCATVFVGGVARLFAGTPDATYAAVIVAELVIPPAIVALHAVATGSTASRRPRQERRERPERPERPESPERSESPESPERRERSDHSDEGSARPPRARGPPERTRGPEARFGPARAG